MPSFKVLQQKAVKVQNAAEATVSEPSNVDVWTNEEFAADAQAAKDSIRAMGEKAIAEHRAGKTMRFPTA